MSTDRHEIALSDAVRLVERAREQQLLSVHGWAVDAAIVRRILDQPEATGLRAYLAVGDDGVPTLVYVGVDAKNHDLSDGVLAEYLYPCPPFCPDGSPFQGTA